VAICTGYIVGLMCSHVKRDWVPNSKMLVGLIALARIPTVTRTPDLVDAA
jgi:hypothetical protein